MGAGNTNPNLEDNTPDVGQTGPIHKGGHKSMRKKKKLKKLLALKAMREEGGSGNY
tara:strand:+ start:28625 stop:28792 length:168 start_codon:yes stop_codon:yes gene_type:complete